MCWTTKLILLTWLCRKANESNRGSLHFEQERRKSFFFASYVWCGFVYDWEESRQEGDPIKGVINKRKRKKRFADRVRVYSQKCPAALMFTNQFFFKRNMSRHTSYKLFEHHVFDHSDQLATYLVEKVFLLQCDSTEQWVE